ncbi:hypothetical protein DFP72DRAFT_1076452 [Ephemerocybe angulata]|uniref:Uncharacterized protein n=1 Tax=Ephemerocybe angulata TaxID=980116 RepID=A0A8H6HI64_9AGAR|nr:hypothetical protein DFP72DRAFT_1076452 [Tulosesus angulatus]
MKRLDESKHVYPAKRQRLAITAAAAAGVEPSTQRVIADLDVNQEVIGVGRSAGTTQKKTASRAGRPQPRLSDPMGLRTRAQKTIVTRSHSRATSNGKTPPLIIKIHADLWKIAVAKKALKDVTTDVSKQTERDSTAQESTTTSAVVQGPPPMRKTQMKAASAHVNAVTVAEAKPVLCDTPVAEDDSEDTDSDATDIEETATGGEPHTEPLSSGEGYQATISLAGGYHRRAVLFKPTSEIQDYAPEDIVSAICLIQLSASEGLESPLESEDRVDNTPQPQVLQVRNMLEPAEVTEEERDAALGPQLKVTQASLKELEVETEQLT